MTVRVDELVKQAKTTIDNTTVKTTDRKDK